MYLWEQIYLDEYYNFYIVAVQQQQKNKQMKPFFDMNNTINTNNK